MYNAVDAIHRSLACVASEIGWARRRQVARVSATRVINSSDTGITVGRDRCFEPLASWRAPLGDKDSVTQLGNRRDRQEQLMAPKRRRRHRAPGVGACSAER
jgi:hypothetical protein